MTQSITTGTDFTATRAVTSGPPAVDLRIDMHGIHFVPGTIDSGPLAGTPGHREEPWHTEETHRMGIAQARHLRDQLTDAIGDGTRSTK